MAHDWTRKAQDLETTTLRDFSGRFGAELADVAAGYPDRPPGQIVADAFHMHRRQGGGSPSRRQVSAIAELADHILAKRVASGSLLASLLLSGVQATPETVRDDVADSERLDVAQPIFPLRLVLDPAAGPHLRIKGLGEFRGAHLGLVNQLRPFLEEDVEAELSPQEHRFVAPGRLGGAKGTVRQRAKRCRDEFAEQFETRRLQARQPHPTPLEEPERLPA